MTWTPHRLAATGRGLFSRSILCQLRANKPQLTDMGMIWRPQAEAARTELYDRTWPDTSHAPGRLDISFTTRREADRIVAAEPVGVVRDPISARLGCIPGVAGLRARGERTAIVEEGGGMRGFGSLAVPTGGARKTAGRLGVCHTRSPRSPYIPHSPHRRDPSPEPHALTSAPEALLPNARDALHRRRPPRAGALRRSGSGLLPTGCCATLDRRVRCPSQRRGRRAPPARAVACMQTDRT